MEAPKPVIDKTDSRRIRAEIRRVLFNVWDPIGIRDEPNAQDEYNGYIGRVYELLVSKARNRRSSTLYWAAHDHMGLDAARWSDMIGTVEALAGQGGRLARNDVSEHVLRPHTQVKKPPAYRFRGTPPSTQPNACDKINHHERPCTVQQIRRDRNSYREQSAGERPKSGSP